MGKLIYITVTRPDIAFTVQILTQFMRKPTIVHMHSVTVTGLVVLPLKGLQLAIVCS